MLIISYHIPVGESRGAPWQSASGGLSEMYRVKTEPPPLHAHSDTVFLQLPQALEAFNVIGRMSWQEGHDLSFERKIL